MSKRPLFILTFLTAGAIASIVACGGGSDSQKSGDIVAEIAHAECGAAFRCMSSYPGTDFAVQFGSSEANCEMKLVSGVDASVEAAADASIAAGRIKIDDAAKASCESYFSTAACTSVFMNPPASCHTFAVGTVAIGGACTSISQTAGSGGTVTVDIGDCVTGGMCDPTTKKCVAAGFAPATTLASENLGHLLAQ